MAPKFARAHIRAMEGYAPGEQPSAGERAVKLNTNENPFPPSPRVMQAIRDLEPELLRRYPERFADTFRDAAAKSLAHAGITRDMILCGNGSDELLSVAARTFVGSDGAIAAPVPTYPLYAVLAKLQDARFHAVEWERNWALPVEALVATKAQAVFLANPNVPSGTLAPVERIAALASACKGVVLVDEAYVDFADHNALSLVKDHENLIVTRSFSKGYCLAGLRFGYAVAQSDLIEQMAKVKDSYNCDAISTAAAIAALLDHEYAQMTRQHVRSERERVSSELARLGFLVVPSQANFILATCPGGRGRDVYNGLKRQGILVRYFDEPGLRDKIRITIGTSQENNALLGGLKPLAPTEKAA
jgi:histidinol-phosphate aminotransferase